MLYKLYINICCINASVFSLWPNRIAIILHTGVYFFMIPSCVTDYVLELILSTSYIDNN